MSRARLVITAVVVEGQGSERSLVTTACHRAGSLGSWPATEMRAKPRSSAIAARSVPREQRLPRTVELIVALRRRLVDLLATTPAGERSAGTSSVIGERVSVRGDDRPPPAPRWARHTPAPQAAALFLRALRGRATPNETWQIGLHPLPAGGRHTDTEILALAPTITPASHCARYCAPIESADRSCSTSSAPWSPTAYPASTLTDNGMVFTTRLSGGKEGTQRFRSRADPPRRASRRTRDRTIPRRAGKSNDSTRR